MNAHFKPFAAIGFEYNKVRPQSGTTSLGSGVTFSIPQFGDFFHDMVCRVRLGAVSAKEGPLPVQGASSLYPANVDNITYSIVDSFKQTVARGGSNGYTEQEKDKADSAKGILRDALSNSINDVAHVLNISSANLVFDKPISYNVYNELDSLRIDFLFKQSSFSTADNDVNLAKNQMENALKNLTDHINDVMFKFGSAAAIWAQIAENTTYAQITRDLANDYLNLAQVGRTGLASDYLFTEFGNLTTDPNYPEILPGEALSEVDGGQWAALNNAIDGLAGLQETYQTKKTIIIRRTILEM